LIADHPKENQDLDEDFQRMKVYDVSTSRHYSICFYEQILIGDIRTTGRTSKPKKEKTW
jgi:hypothetical protein